MCTSGSLTGGPRGSQIIDYYSDSANWRPREYGAERPGEMEKLRWRLDYDPVRPEATFVDFVAMSNELNRLVAQYGSFKEFLTKVSSAELAHLRELTERVGLRPFKPQDIQWLENFGINIPNAQEKIHLLFRILDLQCEIGNERYMQDRGLKPVEFN